jgi:hypothetical protein
MSKALELIELGHGLLRELPDARLWGVDDGALVLGTVLMPWQDARASQRRTFVAGFDD